MKGTLTIQPMTASGAQTGDVVGSVTAEFTPRSFGKARMAFGQAIIDAVSLARVNDQTIDLFDLTLELTLEEHEMGKRQFIIDERASYRVMATSKDEAEALFLDKGGERMDSEIEDVYEGNA